MCIRDRIKDIKESEVFYLRYIISVVANLVSVQEGTMTEISKVIKGTRSPVKGLATDCTICHFLVFSFYSVQQFYCDQSRTIQSELTALLSVCGGWKTHAMSDANVLMGYQ